MNSFHLLTSALWFLPLALQLAIAVSMLYRGLARQFPFFFTYNLTLPARDLTLASLPYGGNLYSAVYWWGDGAAILLALVVIVEVAFHLVGRYPFLRFLFKVLLSIAAIAAVAALASAATKYSSLSAKVRSPGRALSAAAKPLIGISPLPMTSARSFSAI